VRGEIISKHYLNGQWVEQDKLAISPLDLAVLRGFGIFDFLTATNGQPFHLDRHLDRYEASAKRLGLASPVSRAELERIISEGIGRNHQHQDLFIRLVLTGGESLDFDAGSTLAEAHSVRCACQRRGRHRPDSAARSVSGRYRSAPLSPGRVSA